MARDYYTETGRPLGITGEVAEVEAVRRFGVTLAPPRQEGYDAVRVVDGKTERIQIKGRWLSPVPAGEKPKTFGGQKLGTIKRQHPWDVVMLVLFDPDYNTLAIYEADREAIEARLNWIAPDATKPSGARERGVLSVSEFKQIGHRVWPSED